ncbi:hypothetical protein HMI55_003330 [Coelomomyces lativittatus]|nr:hypothetical protein HMI55_003330 [Coelomomyces lativittatus]
MHPKKSSSLSFQSKKASFHQDSTSPLSTDPHKPMSKWTTTTTNTTNNNTTKGASLKKELNSEHGAWELSNSKGSLSAFSSSSLASTTSAFSTSTSSSSTSSSSSSSSKKRKTEYTLEKDPAPITHLMIPELLRVHLVEDWEYITRQQQ